MKSIQAVLIALEQHADAEHVSRAFAKRGERLGDGYTITNPEPQVKEVVINLVRERHLLSLPPESVEYTFSAPYALTVRDVAPSCADWRTMPSERHQAWVYLCRAHASGKRPVAISVSLTADIHQVDAKVMQLSLLPEF